MTVLRVQLPLIAGAAAYVGLNFYLWSLHPGEITLLAVSWLLGVIYFAGLFWHIARTDDSASE